MAGRDEAKLAPAGVEDAVQKGEELLRPVVPGEQRAEVGGDLGGRQRRRQAGHRLVDHDRQQRGRGAVADDVQDVQAGAAALRRGDVEQVAGQLGARPKRPGEGGAGQMRQPHRQQGLLDARRSVQVALHPAVGLGQVGVGRLQLRVLPRHAPLQPDDPVHRPLQRQVRPDARQDDGEVERLGQVVVRPLPEGLDHVAAVVLRRRDEDGQVGRGVGLADGPQHLQAVEVRHQHVQQDQVEGALADQRQGLAAALRLGDGEPGPPQVAREHGAVGRLIVDDEDGPAVGGHGANSCGGGREPDNQDEYKRARGGGTGRNGSPGGLTARRTSPRPRGRCGVEMPHTSASGPAPGPRGARRGGPSSRRPRRCPSTTR